MTTQLEWKTIPKSFSTVNPPARWGHSCCIVHDNFYLFGGFADSTYMNDLWEYSLTDFKWKQIITNGDRPQSRSNATLNFDENNYQLLLFGGGGPNKQRFNTVSILNLQTLSWVELKPFQNQTAPWERTYHTAQFLSPYLVVFGGESVDDLGDLWIYNINTLSWMQVKFDHQSVKPEARRFHSSCLVENTLYLFGGCFNKYVCFNDLYSLDLTPLLKEGNQTNQLSWYKIPILGQIKPRWGHSLHYYNGLLYVFGGRGSDDMNDLITINPGSGQILYLKGQKWPKARRRHSGGFIGSSLVLFGGFDGNYFDDLIYINVYQLDCLSTHLQIQKPCYKFFNHTINCVDQRQLPINISKLCRYFSSKSQMTSFMQAINGYYPFQKITQIIQTLQNGYGFTFFKQ